MPEEFNPNAAPGGDAPPAPPVASEPAAEAAGAETATESEPGEEGEQGSRKGYNPVQRRIDRLTQARYRAEAEARVLREELERTRARESAPNTRQAPVDPEPQEEQFTDHREYTKALAAHAARQATREEADRQRAQQYTAQAANEYQALHSAHVKRTQAFAEATPDYEDAISSNQTKLHGLAAAAVMESELGPQILYHLSKNPAEAAAIEKLTPAGQTRYIGKLEAKLSSAPGQKTAVSAAPAPIPSKTGSSGANAKFDPYTAKDPNDPRWDAWRAERNRKSA